LDALVSMLHGYSRQRRTIGYRSNSYSVNTTATDRSIGLSERSLLTI